MLLVEVPLLDDLINGRFSADKAIEMLFYVCEIDASKKTMSDIPQEQICNIVILSHLVKNQSLQKSEAVLIWRTIADVNNNIVPHDIEYPLVIDEQAFRASNLFSNLFLVLNSCIGSIGLKHFQVRAAS